MHMQRFAGPIVAAATAAGAGKKKRQHKERAQDTTAFYDVLCDRLLIQNEDRPYIDPHENQKRKRICCTC